MKSTYTSEWVYRTDVEKKIPGREDPPELKERCWNYLATHHLKSHSATRETARKAAPALAVAKMLRSAGTAAAHGDLERRVTEQEEVISRLLAFVPTRAKPLDRTRLKTIVTDLMEKAYKVFPGAERVLASVYEEVAEDTEACERIVLSVLADVDLETFVASVTELHRYLAEKLSSDEYLAINLVVEPDHPS